MAGEAQGAVFEAITRVALEQALLGNLKKLQVLVHEQPSWISIEPDLAVGTDKDNVEVLVLITHTNSESVSHKKFWRNIAELFQWKVQGPKPVRVVDVVFISRFKPELKKVSESIMDVVLDLGKEKYGNCLIDYVKKHVKDFGNSEVERYRYVYKLCDGSSTTFNEPFCEAVNQFSQALKCALNKEKIQLSPLWQMERDIYNKKKTIPIAKNTSVRNGVAKLMLFDSLLRGEVYNYAKNGNSISLDPLPEYALLHGLLVEDLDGARIEDKDILSVIQLLGKEKCELIISRIPDRMNQYISILRSPENNRLACDFVVDKFEELSTYSGMKKALMECYSDPYDLLNQTGLVNNPPVDNWLFVYCMTIEKALANKVVAYGLSNLAEETGIPEIGSMGGVIISPFINREKELKENILDKVSEVFSHKIKRLGKETLSDPRFNKNMIAMLLQRQLYTLSVYRFFDPLGDLVRVYSENAICLN